jgi:hypothetical protein
MNNHEIVGKKILQVERKNGRILGPGFVDMPAIDDNPDISE